MPELPFPITFTVTDTDGATLKEGAVISIKNTTKDTLKTYSLTTNSNGVVIADLINFPIPASGNKYDIGDVLILIARDDSNNYATASFTVAGTTHDQALTLFNVPDPLQTVLDILSNDWNLGRTDLKTPEFFKITDKKRHSFFANGDFVAAHRSTLKTTPAGIGPANKHEVHEFDLDVRSIGTGVEEHWLNILEETRRILQDNKVNPSSAYIILDFDGDGQDLSNQSYKLFRKLIPVQLERYNIPRG